MVIIVTANRFNIIIVINNGILMIITSVQMMKECNKKGDNKIKMRTEMLN